VGKALLEKRDAHAQYPDWGQGSNAAPEVRDHERAWEALVSEYLGQMEVLWLAVEDEPCPESDRGTLERNAIGLLSHLQEPLDLPSPEWLGHHSPNANIRRSGLWNVNHTLEPHDPGFLDLMERYVVATE